jgi:hypothetical protein
MSLPDSAVHRSIPSSSGVGPAGARIVQPETLVPHSNSATNASTVYLRPKRLRIPLIAASLISSATAVAAPVGHEPDGGNDQITNFIYCGPNVQHLELVDESATGHMTRGGQWRVAWASGPPPVTLRNAMSAISDLECLRDGWNGDSSLAPSEYVKSDLRAIAPYLGNARSPEMEVDEDGSVSLRWEADDRMLALTFHGNGRAIGTMYPRTGNFPCEIPLRDAAIVAGFLAIDEVRSSVS